MVITTYGVALQFEKKRAGRCEQWLVSRVFDVSGDNPLTEDEAIERGRGLALAAVADGNGPAALVDFEVVNAVATHIVQHFLACDPTVSPR